MTDRWLGTAAQPSPDRRTLTGPTPAHLPARLSICLWDFSWLVRAGEGEPYEDIEATMAATAALGYTTVRICAAPLLLSGGLGLDDLARDLEIEGLGAAPTGGHYGQRTRWYDAPGGYRVDARARLFALLESARTHGVSVILASWEYQQTTAFAADPRWWRAIDAVPLPERPRLLADSFARLLDEIRTAGLIETIAFTELHNEVDFSMLPGLEDAEGRGEHGVVAAVDELRQRHPDQLITASLGKPPHLSMHEVPAGLDVGQFHVYSYGVLDALQQRLDIRAEGSEGFPNAALRALLRADAPTPERYGRPAPWKLEATVVTDQMIYGYDWIDPVAWDDWLVEHHPAYEQVMRREIASRVIAIAAWGRWRGVPVVVGEGWVGYTPRDGRFEESPEGLALAEHGIRTALEHGAWGVVPCSNAAPHHPLWADAEWQRRMTGLVAEAARGDAGARGDGAPGLGAGAAR